MRLGDLPAAGEALERGLGIQREVFGTKHLNVAITMNNLANVYRLQGKRAESKRLHETVLEIRREIAPGHPVVAESLQNLAELEREDNQLNKALGLQLRAIEILEGAYGPNHPLIARSLKAVAQIRGRLGEWGESEKLARRAIRIDEDTLGTAHPFTSEGWTVLADYLFHVGRFQNAAEAVLKVEEIGRNHFNLTASALTEGEALHYARVRPSARSFLLSIDMERGSPDLTLRAWDAVSRSRARLDRLTEPRRLGVGRSGDRKDRSPARGVGSPSGQSDASRTGNRRYRRIHRSVGRGAKG